MEARENQKGKNNARKIMDIATLWGSNTKSKTQNFILTFEILNMNVHNILADSGASINVMPLVVSEKITAQPKKYNTKMVKMDRLGVIVVGILSDVFIRFPSKPCVT